MRRKLEMRPGWGTKKFRSPANALAFGWRTLGAENQPIADQGPRSQSHFLQAVRKRTGLERASAKTLRCATVLFLSGRVTQIAPQALHWVAYNAYAAPTREASHVCSRPSKGGALRILLGILAVALVATLCDYTWYTNHVPHNMITGITYGVVLLMVVGAVLGFDAGPVLKGLPIGALAGVGGALTYYLLIAVMDKRTYGPAIPASWVALWFILAALDGRWLREPRRPWREVAIRGALAAIVSGLSFYLVLTTL